FIDGAKDAAERRGAVAEGRDLQSSLAEHAIFHRHLSVSLSGLGLLKAEILPRAEHGLKPPFSHSLSSRSCILGALQPGNAGLSLCGVPLSSAFGARPSPSSDGAVMACTAMASHQSASCCSMWRTTASGSSPN